MKLGLVRPTEQLKGQRLCFVIFAICLSARFIEYFLIETDKRAIGENVFHKIFGIVILAAALKVTDIKWRDIGFQRDGSVSGILKGMLLGSVCFSLSYGLGPAVKFCVSEIRQNQGWRWKNSADGGLNPLVTHGPQWRGGMRAGGVNAAAPVRAR